MKRWTILALVVLIGGALHAETLFDAIKDAEWNSGDLKKIKAQVEVIEADVNAKSIETFGETAGYTPLVYAIDKLPLNNDKVEFQMQLRRDIVAYLLAHKANPNGIATPKGDYGKRDKTPLVAALFTKDWALVKMLLDAGADPSLPLRLEDHVDMNNLDGDFGKLYKNNPKLKATSLDVAILLHDPVFVGLIKAKAPKLVPNYNLSTLWYLAFTNDLVGFKKQIKAGMVPSGEDVAYLIHYGKKDFIAFVDAAAIAMIPENASDIAILSDYLDKNIELTKTDMVAFSNGLLSLQVDWEKVRKQGTYAENIITGFSHQDGVTKAFKIAFYPPELDGFYESSGSERLWFAISANGSQFEARYTKKPEDNKSGAITVLDVDVKSGRLLCDLSGFGKYWVSHGYKESINMNTELKSGGEYIGFNLCTKEAWEAMQTPSEGGK